ncbi:MAG: hypothetical protein EB069_11510 [Actinobacteria bacterium]|nr:hypothetical protein [Actinomycetota bacterium]
MAKVTIDGVDYDTDTMSQESRQQLEMLMMTEQKIRQMQAEVAMLQTARQAYASALRASLVAPATPEAGLGETFKF